MVFKKGVLKENKKDAVIKKVICEKCCDYIDIDKDHYVCLSTYNRLLSPNHHAYFHFSCWVDYFRECVEQRVLKVGDIMDKTMDKLLRSPLFNQVLDYVPRGQKIVNIEIQDEKNNNGNRTRKIAKKRAKKIKN